MLELLWKIRPRPILVHKNPVRHDFMDFAPVDLRRKEDGPLRLGIVGRMAPVKGFPIAFHALRLLRDDGVDCRLHAIGTGPNEAALRRLARKLGIETCVTFEGYVTNPAECYGRLDLSLCPSIREPFGNVCVEAGYFGCPVIATAVDGIPETILHEKTGLCLEPTRPMESYEELGGSQGAVPKWVYYPSHDAVQRPRFLDPAGVAASVKRLARNPEERLGLGAAARRFITDEYRCDRFVSWYNDILLGLAKGHGSCSPHAP